MKIKRHKFAERRAIYKLLTYLTSKKRITIYRWLKRHNYKQDEEGFMQFLNNYYKKEGGTSAVWNGTGQSQPSSVLDKDWTVISIPPCLLDKEVSEQTQAVGWKMEHMK